MTRSRRRKSGEELTIRSSGGFIKIDGSGITIQGKVVNINTGGSPGVGIPVQPMSPGLQRWPRLDQNIIIGAETANSTGCTQRNPR